MLEFVAGIFSLLSVYLTVKNNKWCWPVGIVGIIFYLLIFFENKLYSDCILQIIFILQSIMGWLFWSDSKREIKRMRFTEYILGFNILLVLTVLLYQISSYFNGDSLLIDSLISSLSILAMLFMSTKRIEAWFIWILVDLLLIGLFFNKQLYFSSFVYFIFLVLCVKGFLDWKKDIKIV